MELYPGVSRSIATSAADDYSLIYHSSVSAANVCDVSQINRSVWVQSVKQEPAFESEIKSTWRTGDDTDNKETKRKANRENKVWGRKKEESERERKTRGCHVVKHRGKAGTEISDHRKQRRKEGGRDKSRLTRISAPWLRVLGVTLMLRSQHCLSTPAVTLLRTE